MIISVGKSVEKVYHYTGFEAFQSIMRGKEIGDLDGKREQMFSFRFGDIFGMEDLNERFYGFSFFVKVLEENKLRFPCSYQALQETFSEEEIDDLKKEVYRKETIEKLSDVKYHYFLFCTCLDGNDDTMWKLYAGKQGVSMELNVSRFLDSIRDEPRKESGFLLYHGQVLYEEQEQRNFVLQLLKEIERWTERTGFGKEELRHRIWRSIPFLKKKEYMREKEYRFLFCCKQMTMAAGFYYRYMGRARFIVNCDGSEGKRNNPYLEIPILHSALTGVCSGSGKKLAEIMQVLQECMGENEMVPVYYKSKMVQVESL